MSAIGEEYDGLYMNVAQRAGSIDNIFDSFFGFLNRKTDFYAGAADKKAAESFVLKSFEKYWEEAQKKKDEDKKRNLKADEERKKRAAEKKKKDDEEWAKRQKTAAATATDDNKVEEVDIDTPVGIVKDEKPETKSTSSTSVEKEEKKEDAEDKKEEEDNSPPPLGNGGSTDRYTWTQTLAAVEIAIPVKPGCKSKDFLVEIKAKTMKIAYKNDLKNPIVEGKFQHAIKTDDTMWTLVDNKSINIQLEKYNGMSWWSSVLIEDEEKYGINTQKIVPENSKLGDLDGDTRQTVEKMMFDQRAKAAGKPTSDQSKQHEMLQKFMKQHPEMDFSKCKINYGDNNNNGGFNFGGM